MDVENSILVRLRFGESGGTHSPRISRSICNLNPRVVVIRSFDLILPYLEPISAVFTSV